MDSEVSARVGAVLDARPTALTELDGGHVGRVFRVSFADRPPVVAKVGDTPLDVEAKMLGYLERETSLPVPEVYWADADLLVMEYVDGASDAGGDGDGDAGGNGRVTPGVERDVAEHLARLHDNTADAFGFPFDTLSGPYRQPNPWCDSWVEFFRDYRLRRWADGAVREGALPVETRERIERLAARLEALLSDPAAPALVHGDVWAGNLIVGADRVRAFLDPAIYFGHPEVELAYADRFAGFGDAFFERYRELRGIRDGFAATRRHVYNLVPLLEHLRVFGDRYLAPVRDTLDRLDA